MMAPMPELPEVEFARRLLAPALARAKVHAIHVYDARVVRPSARGLRAAVGLAVVEVERRGKWIRIALDGGPMLLSHLGMSGKWLVRDGDAPAERFERVRIDVTQRARTWSLRYVDPRMLGRVIFA